jgi:hypothetical protein
VGALQKKTKHKTPAPFAEEKLSFMKYIAPDKLEICASTCCIVVNSMGSVQESTMVDDKP